jgi:hypothetical protein
MHVNGQLYAPVALPNGKTEYDAELTSETVWNFGEEIKVFSDLSVRHMQTDTTKIFC